MASPIAQGETASAALRGLSSYLRFSSTDLLLRVNDSGNLGVGSETGRRDGKDARVGLANLKFGSPSTPIFKP